MALKDVTYWDNFDSNLNPDRVVITLIDGDIPNFSSDCVRAVQFKRAAFLGNHWREYPELYGVIGQARFMLEDITSKERKDYELKTGDRLLVPPRIALKITAEEGTVLFSCSSKTNRDEKTHKYEVK